MRKIILGLCIGFSQLIFSQVDADAIFALQRVTTTEMNAIVSPAEGAMVYNTDTERVYEYDGAQWLKLMVEKSIIKNVTANYTLVLTDNGCAITANSTTDMTITIPAGLPVGYNVSIYQIGTGVVTIQGAAGVTVRHRLLRFKTAGQDAGVGVLSTGTDTYHITGDLTK